MVQRSVEFDSSPSRIRIVILRPHMDKSKSQPRHPISAELTLGPEKLTFPSLTLGGGAKVFLSKPPVGQSIIAHESHESEFPPRSSQR